MAFSYYGQTPIGGNQKKYGGGGSTLGATKAFTPAGPKMARRGGGGGGAVTMGKYTGPGSGVKYTGSGSGVKYTGSGSGQQAKPPGAGGYAFPADSNQSTPHFAPLTNFAVGGGAGSERAGGAKGIARDLEGVMSGFLDPESEYFQKLMSRLRGEVGKGSAAAQRAAALAAAESGSGAGMSPELAQMMAMIGEEGLAQQGEAGANLALAAPQMGLQFGQVAGQLDLGQQNINEDRRQFNRTLSNRQKEFARNLAEGQRQFDVGAGFTAQGIANEASRRNTDEMMRMFAMMLGGI